MLIGSFFSVSSAAVIDKVMSMLKPFPPPAAQYFKQLLRSGNSYGSRLEDIETTLMFCYF